MNNKIYTWGYSTSDHDDLRAFVKATNAMVVDIRFSAHSRLPEWNGSAIAMAVGSENYMHMQSFGNRNYKGDGPIELANPIAGLGHIRKVLEKRPVILLCVCWDYRTCHRLTVAEYIGRAMRMSIEHLPAHFSQWVREKAA